LGGDFGKLPICRLSANWAHCGTAAGAKKQGEDIMGELTANVNWLGVIVGTVASFLLGWLWYSPKLFGVKWAEGIGVELGAAASMPAAAMVTQLIATFLLAWLVGITAGQKALMTIILIALTIIIFIISNGLFAKKSNYAISVEAGFIAAMTAVMIIVQGIF
jgi:Protein of unknown function (DUF1761)